MAYIKSKKSFLQKLSLVIQHDAVGGLLTEFIGKTKAWEL